MPHLTCDRIERERPQLRHERFVAVRQAGQVMRVTAVCRRIPNTSIVGQALANVRAAMPGLVAVECGADADREAQCVVADWARGFGPVVALYERDAVMVEVGGSAYLFDGENAMALTARRGLARLGFMARVTVAATPRAAYAYALAGKEGAWGGAPTPSSALLGGAGVPPASGNAAILAASLPLSTLSLDHDTLQTLSSLGLRTVGDILKLPREGLPSRLGETLIKRLDHLTGTAEESLDLYTPESGMCERVAFDTPIDDGQTLLFIVKRMVDRMAERLSGSGTGALSLRLSLRMEGVAPPLHLDVRAAEPMCDPRALMLLLSARLDALDLGDDERIEAIDLHVTARGPLPARSRGLFDGKSRRNHGQLADLLARLTARIGSEGVSRAMLTEDRRPAKAWRAVPFLEGDEMPEPRKVKAKRKPWRDYDGSTFSGDSGSAPPRVIPSEVAALGDGVEGPVESVSRNQNPICRLSATSPSPPAGNIIRGHFPPREVGIQSACRSQAATNTAGETPAPPTTPRPLRLFPEPHACSVTLHRGHPARITFGACASLPIPPRHDHTTGGWEARDVVAADGPERITSAWWEPAGGEAHDLWRIQLDDSRMLWLSRNLREGNWQVLGTWG